MNFNQLITIIHWIITSATLNVNIVGFVMIVYFIIVDTILIIKMGPINCLLIEEWYLTIIDYFMNKLIIMNIIIIIMVSSAKVYFD